MIVDDNPYALFGLRALLRNAADMVVAAEATTGADALRLYRDVQPDVVITDLEMPRMDGCQLTTAIKAVCPQQPIVVLFLDDGPTERRSARQAGADVFLSKELALTQLLRHIRRLRSRRAA
jgi:DNA-binding NarL/FixJ family response regulator